MTKRAAAAVPAVLSALLACDPALAQCMPREDMLHYLEEHGERPAGGGIGERGKVVVELFLSGDGATWTIVVTRPDGLSCLRGAGRNWLWSADEGEGEDT